MDVTVTGAWADTGLMRAVCGEAVKGVADANGALRCEGLSDASMDRLRFHAAVHGAELSDQSGGLRLVSGAASLGGQVFDAGPLTPRWREIWCEAAGEILACRGRQTPETVRGRLTMIWARAESRLRARATPRTPPSGLDQSNLRIRSVETPYAGFFLTRDYVYSHDLFDGGDSGPLARSVFVMADAVTVLPYDPVRDRVLVIEQIRASPIGRGDPCPWLLEPVAGRIEPGDTPEATAHKEAREEAHLTLGALHHVADYYPSTGAFTEYLYSYIGIADLPDEAATLGGLETEGEDIRGHVMTRRALMARIAAGDIPVGPLILSALWLELNADRLRASG